MTSSEAPHSILIVEDDEHIAYLLEFMLQREGYQVVRLTDGQAAAKLIVDQPPPSLALLDVMLPYIDGFQLVKLIRANSTWNEVPIVMLSAKGQERDIVNALDAGADDYIVKPFQPMELTARIKRILKGTK